MKLVVGLGNPGGKYRDTRHNVGFSVLALLAKEAGADKPKQKFEAELCEVQVEGERVLLLCPLTYMNLSGKSVLAARDFFKLDHGSILVVCDDFNLPLGRLRIRADGSAGGQKGLQDILQQLGTQSVPRLRLGIGPTPGGWNPADFVLGKFTKTEQEAVDVAVAQAVDAVRMWIRQGVEPTMNRYNAAPENQTKERKQDRPSPDKSRPQRNSSQGSSSGAGDSASQPTFSPKPEE